MKVAIISDWHLIGPGKWSHTTDKQLLLDFLLWAQDIKKGPDLVIFAGDIFDTKLDSWENIMKSHQDIADIIKRMLKKKRAIYVFGNHDLEMEQRWNLPETYVIPGTKTLVMHGHQLNYDKRWMNRIEKKISALANMFEWTKWLLHIGNKPLFYRRAKRFLKKNKEYNQLIYGHAHQPYVSKKILNSGCSLHGKSHFLYLRDGSAKICHLKDGFSNL